MVYYTTYVVHTKIFFWDFDNDSYAQNSEIILTIRIQKNFFKIPIGKFFEKLSKSKKKICVYHICGILYHICGSKLPHTWYTIPHMWYTIPQMCIPRKSLYCYIYGQPENRTLRSCTKTCK